MCVCVCDERFSVLFVFVKALFQILVTWASAADFVFSLCLIKSNKFSKWSFTLFVCLICVFLFQIYWTIMWGRKNVYSGSIRKLQHVWNFYTTFLLIKAFEKSLYPFKLASFPLNSLKFYTSDFQTWRNLRTNHLQPSFFKCFSIFQFH